MARRALSRSPEAVLADPEIPDFRQERARRSYLALLESAAELFAHQGYDAVGTPEIAQKAGVSVGTFYRYFDDKHEVYLEIMRRMMVGAYREVIENLTPERFVGLARHETIYQGVGLLFDHVLSNPQLMRSFMEMSLRDPQVAELRRAVEVLATQRLAELISLIADPKDVRDPDAFAYVLYGSAMQCAYGLAVHLVPTSIDRERARASLTAFIERALFPGK